MSDVTVWNMGTCEVCWGSHGCGLDAGHDGDHACIEPGEDEPCCTVDQSGVDPSGFQWFLYGQHAPTAEGRGE